MAMLRVFAIISFVWPNVSLAQEWTTIDQGIYFTTIDQDIWVVKLTKPFSMEAVYAKGEKKVLPDWVDSNYAVAGINMGMFHDGHLPSGYTKINGKVIQPKMAAYNAFIVWNADSMAIVDRTVTAIDKILAWPNVSQNIRMIAAKGQRNRWREPVKKWSVATLGIDKQGNAYLFHSRKPYNMRSYIDLILASPLPITMMVYLEGGPESSIVVRGHFSRKIQEYSRMGSYESGFWENDSNDSYWQLPFALIFHNL